jgi:hypothetical protein
MSEPAQEITEPQSAWSECDPKAHYRLAPLVYDELHRLAQGYMHSEREGHVPQSTALINQARWG